MATATEIIIQVSERFLNDGTLPYMITDAVSDIRNAPELAGREIEIRSYIMSYGNAMIDIKVTGIENQLTQLIIEDKVRKLLPLRRNWRSLTRHVTVLK